MMPGKRKTCGNRDGSRFFGLLLLVLGITTLCAFLLPIKIWLVLLAGVMIFFGYKLFVD